MIPKVINYCWFGGAPIPSDVKKCVESWKKFCPDYEIKLWNEDNFDVTSHPFLNDAYKSKSWAFVSDYARLKIIFDNGGIYLDTDVELVKNLDDLLNTPAYFGLQQPGDYVATGLGFGAQKGNRAVHQMLKEYDLHNFDEEKKREIACPILNTSALVKIGYQPSIKKSEHKDFIVYPADYFDPHSVGNAKNLLSRNTYSIHHYTATWEKPMQRFKRVIINKIGQEKILFIKNLFGRLK